MKKGDFEFKPVKESAGKAYNVYYLPTGDYLGRINKDYRNWYTTPEVGMFGRMEDAADRLLDLKEGRF